jgi:hypothetical protein
MKRISLVAALLAVGATVLAFAGSAVAAPSSIPCTGSSLAGTTINKSVDVPAGQTCDLSWATINGPVTVEGTLVSYGMTTFNGNVTVNPGGSFGAANWGVTINGNLSITDPAANSGNGFWGDYSPNLVTGGITYTITPAAAAAYPQYQWPYLYFGGPTTVNGNVHYSVGALSSIRPFAQGNMTASHIYVS